jgi:predicted DNA-binding transcriptional regulator YafY
LFAVVVLFVRCQLLVCWQLLVRWLLSMAFHVQVLQPDYLVARMKADLMASASLYK